MKKQTIDIIMAGVGGQGLVLLTDMLCEVAYRAGYEVKSNDVVGLSQRGAKFGGVCGLVQKFTLRMSEWAPLILLWR